MAAKIKGIPNVKSALNAFKREVEKNQKNAIKLTANAYKNDVQKIAPYKTGTYRRSIHVEMQGINTALVGTNLPYGRRLEYGYADTDSLGRTYNQAAQPHFRPPLDTNMDKYEKIYQEALLR